MVYINTLTHHFENKEANHANLKGFDIEKISIKKYGSFEKYYKEMQVAGIVIIGLDTITFPAVWSAYVEKKALIRQSPEEMIATVGVLKPIETFEAELKQQGELFNLVAAKNGISVLAAKELMPIFIHEQTVMKKTYPSIGQVMWHFMNWSRKDYNQKKSPPVTKAKGNKIIGLE